MASALLELRKAAGYRTAAEFAAVVKISSSTYARYESNPDKIPMEPARKLADWFRVPLDVIVERKEMDVQSLRGDIQREYDALSEKSKLALDQFLAFLLHMDGEKRQRDQAEAEHRIEELALRYEAMWYRELDERGKLEDLLVFGGCDEQRAGFKAFVEDRAKKHRERTGNSAHGALDKEGVERVMAAYDWIHGGPGVGGAIIPSLAFERLPVAAECDVTRGAREGGAMEV